MWSIVYTWLVLLLVYGQLSWTDFVIAHYITFDYKNVFFQKLTLGSAIELTLR